MKKTLREALEEKRATLVKQNGEKLTDKDMDQLEWEFTELADIIVESYLKKEKNKNRKADFV